MEHELKYIGYDPRDAVGDKTAEGMAERARRGLWNGGLPPFGYDLAYYNPAGDFLYTLRYLPDGSKIVTDAIGNIRHLSSSSRPAKHEGCDCRLTPGDTARVELVRRIFDWYTREGLGARQIAALLNEQPVPSPRGGASGWTYETVKQLLRNPAYCGDTVWNRSSLARSSEVGPGDSDHYAYEHDTHAPLIPRETFDRAQSARSDRSVNTSNVGAIRGQGAKSEYLLTGLVGCRHCGKPWRARPPKKGVGDQTVYYACGTYIARGNASCPKCLIPQVYLDRKTISYIADNLSGALIGDGFEEVLIALCRAELTAAGIELTRHDLMQAVEAGELYALVMSWPVHARRIFLRAFLERITIDPSTGETEWTIAVPR